MKRRWIGYAVWLALAVCLYFFENNTGTRVVLFCSLLFPLIPLLRRAFFSPDERVTEQIPETLTVKAFASRETEEPGDIRAYRPGDPVQRIHWKLSAKKDELLVRGTDSEQEPDEIEQVYVSPRKNRARNTRKHAAVVFPAGIAVCVILLLLIPEANRGAQALFNRLFAASEAVNSYAYRRFPVPESQNVSLAAFLLLCIPAFFLVLMQILRSRLMALGMMAACTLFQVYFGLAFPAWINIPLYALLALRLMKRHAGSGRMIAYCAAVLLVSLLTALLLPGVDAAVETASETVRDRLSETVQQITGTADELSGGETETRHVHTRSVENGENEAGTEREFRPVAVEEEQISMPHWVNWVKMILLFLLAAALTVLPFAPFLLLNVRKKKAQEIRKSFASESVNEAVRAIFGQVILWLEATGHGAGNLLYREWSCRLGNDLPEGYAERFARCAADYEEALYSTHLMPEQKRRAVLDLLKETEAALWKNADRKQRFRLKYWMCIYE